MNWRSELFADASGYNVYLPAFLLYHWDGRHFPLDIENKVGAAFKINPESGFIDIKVTCGIAYLQSPFFVAANLLTSMNHEKVDGYSYYNFRVLDVCGSFYLSLGLFFVFSMLRSRFSLFIAVAATCFIGFGSNVFFYGFLQPGYSHIYSFAVFAALLWYFDRISELPKYTFKHLCILGLLYGLAVLIRPTNIFIGLLFLFWNTFGWIDIKLRFKKLIRGRNLLALLLPFFLVMLPQMLYWYFTFGTLVYYSYPGEGFTNWQSPHIASLWFEPENGLFPYAPILLLVFVGIVLSLIKKQKGSILPPLLFVIMTYVFASWHDTLYGGSFGCRPFAEYFVFFALPMAYLLQFVRPKLLKGFIVFVAIVCMAFTIKMTLIYNDNSFYGDKRWNWKEYISLIQRGMRTTTQELEDGWVKSKNIIETSDPHHGKHIYAMNKKTEFTPLLLDENYMKGTFSPYRYADVSIDIKSDSAIVAILVHTIDSCGKQLKWDGLEINYDGSKLNQWQTISFYDVWIGGDFDKNFSMKYSIWNRNRRTFYFDNLSLFLH